MPPIVAEVIRLLWIGSSSGWFGLGCPAHCSASGPLLISVFVSGFGVGALSLLAFLWTFRHTLFYQTSEPPPVPKRPPSLRLAGYLHERSARSH